MHNGKAFISCYNAQSTMKKCWTSTICNLILIGTCLPWGCVGDEAVVVHRNVRRRTRFIKPRLEAVKGKLMSQVSLFLDDKEFNFRAEFSMPGSPTMIPVKPPAREGRDTLIQNKCGVTALERSRDILSELLTVSDASALRNPETSQYKAREWLDNIDKAIICSDNTDRIDQRYRLALLYYELGGSTWTRCKADQDVIASSKEEECPGKRFLDMSDECDWYGMKCDESYNVATTEGMDAYYPLEVLNIQSNNVNGELYKEFYGFPSLKQILLSDNSLSGTIDEEIRNFQDVTVLQLDFNSFEGPVPENGLFEMKQLGMF